MDTNMDTNMVTKFTKEDLQKAIETDNAHRYRGVTCGLVALSDLRAAKSRPPAWDYSLPTVQTWDLSMHSDVMMRRWADPGWDFYGLMYDGHSPIGTCLFNHIRMEDGAGVVLAGGKVALGMMCDGKDYLQTSKFRQFVRSDFDLFIVGMTEDQAEAEILSIIEDMKESEFDKVNTYRNQNCVTIVCVKGDLKMTIQIILRIYSSISEIIHGFDVGGAQVAYDGNEIWLTSLGRVAYEQGIIVLNLSRRRGTYESRLEKYTRRGFALVLPNLDASKFERYTTYGLPFLQIVTHKVDGNSIKGYLCELTTAYSDYGGCDYLPKEVKITNFRKLMLSTDENLKNLFLFYEVGEGSLDDIEAPLPTLKELQKYYRNSVLCKLENGDMTPKHLSRFMPDALFKDHARNLMSKFLTGYGSTPTDYWKSMQLTEMILAFTERRKVSHFDLQDDLKPKWKAVEEGTTLKEDQKMINPFKMEEVSVEKWYGKFYAENA